MIPISDPKEASPRTSMGTRRSSYTLLPHSPDDHLPLHHEPESADGQMARLGSAFGVGLQRQSSGSSYYESSLSGDGQAPNLSTVSGAGLSPLEDASFRGIDRSSGGSWWSGKSWAQQTEETYQLQLALALRLSFHATLDPVLDGSGPGASSWSSSEAISHRFWVDGCLSYSEKVPDGFYLIHGMDPYVWTMCTDLQENGRVPSLESLKAVDPCGDSSIGAVLIDRLSDPGLKELQHAVFRISQCCITPEEVVDHLAKLVSNHMGGSAFGGEDDLYSNRRKWGDDLKDRLGSVVFPVGSLSVGLCRHRALLFKVLADSINLPCRIAKGCKYCLRDDSSSCLVQFGPDREYFVDLIGKPGYLCGPDSLLNGPSSISISSPLHFPRLKPSESPINIRSLAEQYFADSQMLNLVFSDALAAELSVQDGDFHLHKSSSLSKSIRHAEDIIRDPVLHEYDASVGHAGDQPILAPASSRVDAGQDLMTNEGGPLRSTRLSQELSYDVEDFDIAWSDLILGERIGALFSVSP